MDAPTLYHGTRAGFRGRGGLLAPRASHGATGTAAPLTPGATPRPDSEAYVYVTTNKVLAWVYAWHAQGRGRPRVLTVRPLSDVWPDPEHSAAMGAYRCEAAVVVHVDFDSPITEAQAREGWAVA